MLMPRRVNVLLNSSSSKAFFGTMSKLLVTKVPCTKPTQQGSMFLAAGIHMGPQDGDAPEGECGPGHPEGRARPPEVPPSGAPARGGYRSGGGAQHPHLAGGPGVLLGVAGCAAAV
jgi:hypothetical protein